jgi:regulation of enolase protein 1 (concanavalin A-like superfamily)
MEKRARTLKKGFALAVRWLLIGVLILGMNTGFFPTKSAASATEPYGLSSMEQFDRLPYLKVDTMAGQNSSYDRAGSNRDGWLESNFLYTDANGEKVLLDVKGPGTVYRLWFAGDLNLDATNLKFYFDGETTPRINMLLKDIFDGTISPFLKPLIARADTDSSGGWNVYVPFPFAQSMKITTNKAGVDLFYHVGYHTYSPDTAIATWTGSEDSTAVRNMWNNAGTDPKSDTGNTTVSNTINLAAGQTQTLLNVAGPRSISSIKLGIPGVPGTGDKDILNNIRLRIYWDNEVSPSVDASLGSFFAMGEFGSYATRALPVGLDANNKMYVYFPMPFAGNAKVELVSSRGVSTDNIFYEIKHKDFTDSFTNVGYFKTYYTDLHPKAGDGSDYVLLDVDGTGHLVGIVQSMTGATDRRYLEGDERIYVDGSKTPAFIGTGTEDIYGGGGYFVHGPFTLPLHGNPTHVVDNTKSTDSTSAYRFLLQDAVPFRNHIKLTIEHGADLNFNNHYSTGANSANMDSSSLAYYYHKPNQSLVLSDTLNVGDSSSELNHSYTINNQTWSGSLTGTYEGNDDDKLIIDNGREHLGYSQFNMAIPSSNQGIVLRRTFNQSIANQISNVYVDGSLVGKWYRAGSNSFHRWKDDDFIIPASFTSGKTQITIKIVNASSTIGWGEYKYEAYSINYSSSPTAPAATLQPGSDNFSSSVLGPQWNWVREDSAKWSLASAPGSMRITAQSGDLFTTTNTAKNILLQDAPTGDFTITTKLTFPAKPSSNNQQAGLVIYQDDDNYVKLVRGYFNGNAFEFDKEVAGAFTASSTADTIAATTVYLKVVKNGNVYTGYYSTDGTTYTQVGTTQFTSFTSIKVGLIANLGGTGTTEINADFDDFNILKSITPPPALLQPGSDNFSGSALGSQWSWVREDNTHWSLASAPGSMRIRAQTGDIQTTTNNQKNILLQNAPLGDFTITTKVTFPAKPSSNNQQAGLVVYQDDDNYVKLVRGYFNGNAFEFDKEVSGVFTASSTADTIAGTTIYLKMTKVGNEYTGYYSTDGTTYTQVGTAQTAKLSSSIKVGLISNLGSGTTEIDADFDYFNIFSSVAPLPSLQATSDKFSSSTLGSQWSWVREDSARWSLTARPGYMRIIGQSGDLYTTTNTAKNILLQNAPADDFTITTKLVLSAKLSTDFQQAGLIIYQNDDNYLKLVRIHSNGNKFEFLKEVNGSPTVLAQPDNAADTTVYLRITKIGTEYTAYYSTNGMKFTRVGIMQSASLSPIKVGLIAFTGRGKQFNADFDHFNVMTHPQ